jgi:nucleoside-diphosphate-sugar epimerase
MNDSYTILITGATGFVGQHLVRFLKKYYSQVIGTSRKKNKNFITIDENPNWLNILKEVDCVIHLANRAHVMKDKNPEKFHQVNVVDFEHLLNACEKTNVKQFIYLSSIKVNGEETTGKRFFYNDKVNPLDVYARSKYQAEELLKKQKLDWTIIRPPLIYGEGVKGNFASMIKLIKSPIPLPFKGINNKRSLLNVKNLCEVIAKCLKNPDAKNQIFLVSDDRDVSTPELIQKIAKREHQKVILFKLPFLGFIMRLLGKKQQYIRLNQSLQLDIEHTKQQLNWLPKYEL